MNAVAAEFVTGVQNSAVSRFQHSEIIPFEVAEARVDNISLWDWSRNRDGIVSIRRLIEAVTGGRARLPGMAGVPRHFPKVEAVYLAGGRVEDAQLRREAAHLFHPMVFPREPLFASVPGGLEFLRELGLAGWVADLGKSQLKLATSGLRWLYPRDRLRLRPRSEVSPAEVPAQRRRLAEFIAMKLQQAVAETGERPEGLVFALPAQVAGDGTPVGGDYAGLRGNRAFIGEALAMAGLADLPVFVFNDAELAALSASIDPRMDAFRTILVLTLGFGLGAALVCRSFSQTDVT